MNTAPKTGLIVAVVTLIALMLTVTTPSWAQQAAITVTTSTVTTSTVTTSTVTATAQVSASLRTGPDRNYPSVASIRAGTALTVSARSNDSAWLLVNSARGQRGWASARQVRLLQGAILANLPVSSEIIGDTGSQSVGAQGAQSQAATATAIPPTIAGDPTRYAAQITPAVRAAMRRIYVQGLALGNNPRIFAKVGDCLEGFIWFLFQYGDGNAYDLGMYSRLQAAIDHFMVSPRSGVANPYVEQSQAAHPAFTSASVQDPEWTDPQVCQPNESPLVCEYRIDKPSVALVMFGVVDVESLTAAQFDTSMRSIVKQTLSHGIIPIMSTAPENLAYGDKAAQFNRIVTQIAAENSVPLIHLRDALYPLSDHGLDRDGLHLTPGAGWGRIAFTSDQLQLGLPVWNLLALESLDNVWRQIMN